MLVSSFNKSRFIYKNKAENYEESTNIAYNFIERFVIRRQEVH